MLIVIDGTASSGKGTVAKMLANKLGFAYLDTGLLYRCVAYKANKNNFLNNIDNLVKIANSITPEDLQNELLKSDEIAKLASIVAKEQKVRDALLSLQHSFAKNPAVDNIKVAGAVLDGRDLGSFVFPNANYKFFITANLSIRAQRRYKDLVIKNSNISLLEVEKSLADRDLQDSTRSVAPLQKAKDAIFIDTSNYTPQQVLDILLSYIKI
jgi:cytidylate kinase